MFFQVSWIRCHIVWTQGKKERRNPVKTGEKLLTLTIFELQLCSLHQKLRFEEPEWKMMVITHQIKEEKFEIFISVPYRSNKGKGKERIWQRYRQTEEKLDNLSDFQQIQAKFYQLFATVLRWSLENLKKKLPKLSFVWRERGRKEETSCFAKNSQKVTKSAKKNRKKGVPAKNLQILSREMNALANPSDLSPNKAYFGRFGQKVPKSARWENFLEKFFFQSSKKGLKRWKKWF